MKIEDPSFDPFSHLYTNFPKNRDTWRVFPNALTEYELDAIRQQANKLTMNSGKVFDDKATSKGAYGESQDVLKSSHGRISEVGWLTGNTEVENIIWKYISEANKTFQVNVIKLMEVQYTLYHGHQKGHYNTHADTNWVSGNPLDRKLSVTIQLSDGSDYQGGKFEMIDGKDIPESISKGLGTVVVFPSYLRHRVQPVTGGTRKTIVAWAHGPRWR